MIKARIPAGLNTTGVRPVALIHISRPHKIAMRTNAAPRVSEEEEVMDLDGSGSTTASEASLFSY